MYVPPVPALIRRCISAAPTTRQKAPDSPATGSPRCPPRTPVPTSALRQVRGDTGDSEPTGSVTAVCRQRTPLPGSAPTRSLPHIPVRQHHMRVAGLPVGTTPVGATVRDPTRPRDQQHTD